jgi:transcriptional regulator with XRE-family HTH domain
MHIVHHERMEQDWRRLGEAIKRDRMRLGMTQDDLARAAEISRRSIASLENGREASRTPPSLAKVAHVLGWPPERAAAILQGQEELEGPRESVRGHGLVALYPSDRRLMDRLPLRVAEELDSGSVIDTDVIELAEGGMRVVVVLKSDDDVNREQIREAMSTWGDVQRALRAVIGTPTRS